MLHTFPNSDLCVLLHIKLRWSLDWSLVFSLSSPLSCISDRCPGHGVYGQHRERMAGEPGQVRPLPRHQPVAWGWWGWLGGERDPYPHRGGFSDLQLQVGHPRIFFVWFGVFFQSQSLKFKQDWSVPLFPPSGRWLTSTTSASTSPFLMRNANEEEGNQLPGQPWKSALVCNCRLESDSTACVSAAQGHTQFLTPQACLKATSGPCTWNTGKRWKSTATA